MLCGSVVVKWLNLSTFGKLFFGIAGFAENGSYGSGVGTTHAVVYTGPFGCFGIEVGAVVDQPLYSMDRALCSLPRVRLPATAVPLST